MIVEVLGLRVCNVGITGIAGCVRAGWRAMGWARALVCIAFTAALCGCSGAPMTEQFMPAGVGLGSLGGSASCFPTYADKSVTVASSARMTSRDGIALVAAASASMCTGCGSAKHGYTTYDGLPPNSTCVYPTAGDGSEYCCTDALCIPRVPSRCPVTSGPAGAPGSVPPYEWTCAEGARPQAAWGCVPNPLDSITLCCTAQP